MIAIKVECMKYMPSDCDFCHWFGTRPHPYKGWTDICELMGHCMDDDQPEEWIYSGEGRPKACPLVEVADRKTEPQKRCDECIHFDKPYKKRDKDGMLIIGVECDGMDEPCDKWTDKPQTDCAWKEPK